MCEDACIHFLTQHAMDMIRTDPYVTFAMIPTKHILDWLDNDHIHEEEKKVVQVKDMLQVFKVEAIRNLLCLAIESNNGELLQKALEEMSNSLFMNYLLEQDANILERAMFHGGELFF